MTREEKLTHFTNKYRGEQPSRAALLEMPAECGEFSKCTEKGFTIFREWHSEKKDISIIVLFVRNRDMSIHANWYCPQTMNKFQQDYMGFTRDSSFEPLYTVIFEKVRTQIQKAKSLNRSWHFEGWNNTTRKFVDAATGLSICVEFKSNTPHYKHNIYDCKIDYATIKIYDVGMSNIHTSFDFYFKNTKENIDDFVIEAQNYALAKAKEKGEQMLAAFTIRP